jgi:plasmid stability protein
MRKSIQIRGVPEAVHRTLRARAARRNLSLSEFLLGELRALAAQPSMEDMLERISRREVVEPKESPAAAVRKERDAR